MCVSFEVGVEVTCGGEQRSSGLFGQPEWERGKVGLFLVGGR